MTRRVRTCVALVLLVVLGALLPSGAFGSTAAKNPANQSLVVLGGDEDNDVTVTLAAGIFTVTDQSGIQAGDSSCTQVDVKTVQCSADGVTQLIASLSGGSDSWSSASVALRAYVQGGDGKDTLTGGPVGDELSGGIDDDKLYGGDGDDKLAGEFAAGEPSTGTNLLDGGDGNDTLSGGGGVDAMTGGPGNDSMSGFGGNDSADGGEGSDTLSGGDGDDALAGGPGADQVGLPGAAGNPPVPQESGSDRLDGGSGDDALDPGLGAQGNAADDDALIGGDGRDTVSYGTRTSPVSGSIDGVANDGASGEHDDIGPDVEVLDGGAADDVLTGSSGPDLLDGGLGSDRIEGGAGNDTIDGGSGDAGNDDLSGGDGSDTVLGDSGDDELDGGNEADQVAGGGGADTVTGGAGDDVVTGGAGTDDVAGGAGDDQVDGSVMAVVGNDGPDTVSGGAGNDSLRGGDGDDRLDGGTGVDDLGGGAGADSALYSDAASPVVVTLDGKSNDGEQGEGDNVGTDVEGVLGGGVDDTFTGNGGKNTLQGGAGEDYVDGGAGRDVLASGDARDVVRARDGVADTVNCGRGADFAILDVHDKPGPSCELFDNGRSRRPQKGKLFVLHVLGDGEMFGLPGMRRTVPLKDNLRLPFGSRLDATAGSVRVTSAAGRRLTATATISGGSFLVKQRHRGPSVTQLTLTGGASLSKCARGARTVQRRLFGRAHGHFTTRGRFSTATVRGTVWAVVDRCDGTLTRVRRGTVVVRDEVKNRTVTLKAGQHYLARRGNR